MLRITKKSVQRWLTMAGIITMLLPSVAQAAGESYYWQDSSRQAVVATGGDYGTNTVTFQGPQPRFSADNAIECQDESGRADATIEVVPANYRDNNESTQAQLVTSCDTDADSSINIYRDKASAQAAAASGDNSQVTCKAGAFTWFLCDLYDWILDSINWIERNVIIPFLQLSPISMKTDSPTYEVWQQFRNLANIGFIIAFIIMIFSTTLSISMDSYSLKKMLPRLVIAAILVQFSYVLVALAVDVTNIIGYGLQNLIMAPLSDQPTVEITTLVGGLGIGALVAGAFAAAGAIISGSILVILLGAFFAVISVFLTLVARQVLITLLLIISPLAFVAWILPNTDQYFKLWRTTLIRLLMMYPMIVLLFASGKLFGMAAANTGNAGFGSGQIQSLIAVVAGLIPLFLIPLTFRFAGMALNNLTSLLNNGTIKGKFEGSGGYERMKKRIDQRRVELSAGQKVNGFGMVTGNRVAAQLGRGAFSAPTTGNNVRSMVAFNDSANSWKKRLEEENFSYEGVSYLSLGKGWYKNEKADLGRKIAAARAAGDLNQVAVLTEAETRLDLGAKQGELYENNLSARAAAGLRRADMEVLEDADRVQLMSYTSGTQSGELIQRQMWGRMKEGMRKTAPHLAYMDVNGNVDVAELKKFVSKKNQGAWVDYSKPTIEFMADPANHILQDLATDQVTRQVLVNILSHTGGPSIGAEQQQIIRNVVIGSQPTPGRVKGDLDATGRAYDS